MNDPLLHALTTLRQAEPDPVRAARVRAACHAVLDRRRPGRLDRPKGASRSWELAIAGLGGLYLTETIRQALHFYGVL